MAKPTDVPEWALDDDFATGPAPVIGTPTKVDPTTLKNQGFIPGTAAAAQIMNWLLNRGGSWFKWLDGLVDDDGTVAQVKRGMLQVLDSVRSDILAGDADGVYARLRGEENLSHVVASAVEDEVYAALTSWLDTERARLSLRGTLREIFGRDMAGDGAPISVPNGLNVGTSFTPPAGYLPMGIQVFQTAGSSTWTRPAGCRAVKVTCIGGGGGGGAGSGGGGFQGVGGGGGGGGTCVLWLLEPDVEYPVVVGSGGGPTSAGGDTSFGSLAIARGGGAGESSTSGLAAGGAGGAPDGGTYGFRGSDGGIGNFHAEFGYVGGHGGSSSFGGGPQGVRNFTGNPLPGNSARSAAWGAGGGGAINSVDGGSGRSGIIIVEAYA